MKKASDMHTCTILLIALTHLATTAQETTTAQDEEAHPTELPTTIAQDEGSGDEGSGVQDELALYERVHQGLSPKNSFHYNKGRLYHFKGTPGKAEDIQSYCRSKSAQLWSIKDWDDLEWIFKNAIPTPTNNSDTKIIWIGHSLKTTIAGSTVILNRDETPFVAENQYGQTIGQESTHSRSNCMTITQSSNTQYLYRSVSCSEIHHGVCVIDIPKAELQREIQSLYNRSKISESENKAKVEKLEEENQSRLKKIEKIQKQLKTLESQSKEERRRENKKAKKTFQTLKEKINLLQNREKDIFGEDTQYILQAITLLSAVLSTFSIGITVYQLFKRRPREAREEEETRTPTRQATVNAIRQQRYNPTAPRFDQERESIELLSTKRRTQHIRVPRTNTQQ